MKKIALIALLVGILLDILSFSEALAAGTFRAFGPKDYISTTGKPTTAMENFSVLDPNTSYTLHIYNGGKSNQFKGKVSSAVISLNGAEVVSPNEFNQNVSHIAKIIKLSKDDALAVELRSKPDSGLTIEIIGVDNDLPTIIATATPSPNAAGWNNTDVTVSFVCSDTTSGIASCPESVLVQQEGANQVITGTAMDDAGNTASASVTVNLDKTPPVVTIISPLPGATIEDPSVIVQGKINEALSGVAEVTCNGTPAILSSSSFTCNVSLVTGENIIETVATDLAVNTGRMSITVSYLGQKYLAIVDVMVTDWENFDNVPADYTGLAWGGTPTSPFIPNVMGERVLGNNVNVGLWGSTYTTIWVKYDLVPVGSDQPVLVDYGVFHWPYWNVSCPLGWQPANGTSDGNQGALTTGEIIMGDCWRNGLCVQYAPMNQTETFITNVGLSNTGSEEAACPALGEANLGYWPIQADSYDIHKGCGDNRWVYLCYGRGKAWPPASTSIEEVTDAEKLEMLELYAPRVWLAQNESYWPSSVEWAFPHLIRIPCIDLDGVSGCNFDMDPDPDKGILYWLNTRESFDHWDVLDFWRGCNGLSTSNPCTINDTPVYAYWAKKQIQVGEDLVDIVDLVYFFYYPYNRGKEVAGTVWESHVGDWEHVTVRLMSGYDDQSGWSLQPVQIYLSAHDFGYIYEWEDMAKINDTHPVVYSALESHGVWLTPGRHKYGEALGADLVDWTSEGTAWDTWNNVEVFDYNANQGLGSSTWPLWMSDDFANPGTCGDPSNPACGPIYRWGNPERWCGVGYCELTTGPTGPVSKGVWSPGILK